MGTEAEPDSESKIWRLTGAECEVLVFGVGSSFGVNFLTPPISDSHCMHYILVVSIK